MLIVLVRLVFSVCVTSGVVFGVSLFWFIVVIRIRLML